MTGRIQFPCNRENWSRGRWTACAFDSCTKELYHGCLGHAGANNSRHGEPQILLLTVGLVETHTSCLATPRSEIKHLPPPHWCWEEGTETGWAVYGGSSRTNQLTDHREQIMNLTEEKRSSCHSVETGLKCESLSARTFKCDVMWETNRWVPQPWCNIFQEGSQRFWDWVPHSFCK